LELFLALLLTPIYWIEFSCYSLAVEESIALIISFWKKDFRTTEWKWLVVSILFVVATLFVSARLEVQLINLAKWFRAVILPWFAFFERPGSVRSAVENLLVPWIGDSHGIRILAILTLQAQYYLVARWDVVHPDLCQFQETTAIDVEFSPSIPREVHFLCMDESGNAEKREGISGNGVPGLSQTPLFWRRSEEPIFFLLLQLFPDRNNANIKRRAKYYWWRIY
jgi:hypothetical protein